jgi:hypothetical protein
MTTCLKPPRILMVHQSTLGLRHDSIVLAKALRAALPDLDVFSLEVPAPMNGNYRTPFEMPEWLASLIPFDIVFFIEHLLMNHPLSDPAFCRRRVFVPNIEWLTILDERAITQSVVDAVLYKNPTTACIFEQLPGALDIPIRVVTGWTSIDLASGASAGNNGRDFTSFLHVRGESIQKQTEIVIETWLRNPTFPKLTVIATMRDNFAVPVPLHAANNVELRISRLETRELRELQRQHGLHVCPSLAEGFGHSLNEARSCASMLITTGGPPMQDFVMPGVSGMLVPVRPENVGQFRRSASYRICSEDLASTIREVLEFSLEKRREMGLAARKQFLVERDAFEASIAKLFGLDGEVWAVH